MGRHGVALILVLAAAVMVLLALSAVLLRGADRQITSALIDRERQARALIDDIENDLRSFFQSQGAALACPSDRPQVLPLLDWAIAASGAEADGQAIDIEIVVWDGLGGVPLHLAGRGAPLAQAVADPWQGLQLPADLPAPEREAAPTPDRFLTQLPLPPTVAASAERYPSGVLDAEPALLTALSAHSDGRVNWRTAPLPLVEAVARSLGQQVDLEALAAARDGTGDWPALPRQQPQGRPGRRSPARAWLVDGSDRWQACIRLRIAGQRFAYHLVFAGNDEGMQTIQRHACDG